MMFSITLTKDDQNRIVLVSTTADLDKLIKDDSFDGWNLVAIDGPGLEVSP